MMDFLFGAAFVYTAFYFSKHYRNPAKASRSDIRMMSLLIMIYAGFRGAQNLWVAFGGAPFGVLGI